ncbi:glycosyltransferase family 2 protein [Paenibacillus glacialis]|uniref:Glycosyltransferase 2-like domain-containing protein n=1 Tax=Paenibacillus glacialis TaxID=494026 RepID=A0A168NYH3_9BACL|nr:glycosyltransferase [Paenibacillus glacialis]OAB46221.1 hypothetical protein PGLA_02230 [Paenibacillus glacialis]
MLTLSVGIVTRNRNSDLFRCIESIENSIDHCLSNDVKIQIGKLVISNDGSEIVMQNTRYSWDVVEGPKRGIGANRNNIADNIIGDFGLITDDDMEFPLNFMMESVGNLLLVNKNTILTGKVKEFDEFTPPTEPDFWGYRRNRIESSQRPAGFTDQVTWLPIKCFSECKFDDAVIYGPTEMDFAYQLIFNGYEIRYIPELWAIHWGKNKSSVTINKADMEFSRIYYTLRRYYIWDRSVMKLMLFRILEIPRLSFALLKIMGLKGILLAFQSFISANINFEREKHSIIAKVRKAL